MQGLSRYVKAAAVDTVGGPNLLTTAKHTHIVDPAPASVGGAGVSIDYNDPIHARTQEGVQVNNSAGGVKTWRPKTAEACTNLSDSMADKTMDLLAGLSINKPKAQPAWKKGVKKR